MYELGCELASAGLFHTLRHGPAGRCWYLGGSPHSEPVSPAAPGTGDHTPGSNRVTRGCRVGTGLCSPQDFCSLWLELLCVCVLYPKYTSVSLSQRALLLAQISPPIQRKISEKTNI